MFMRWRFGIHSSGRVSGMELEREDGGMARFAELASLAERLAGEASKLKKRAAIAEAIRLVHDEAPGSDDTGCNSDDVGWFALYLAGMPFAEADGRRLNAGGALLSKALLTGRGAGEVACRAAYRGFGDLGAAGFELMQGASGGPTLTGGLTLTLAEVAEAFAAMAVARSTGV